MAGKKISAESGKKSDSAGSIAAHKKRCAELQGRIEKIERIFSDELKRRDRIIENLEKEKTMFLSSAMKEADKRHEAECLAKELSSRLEKAKMIERNSKKLK
jgi:hypothetical protein